MFDRTGAAYLPPDKAPFDLDQRIVALSICARVEQVANGIPDTASVHCSTVRRRIGNSSVLIQINNGTQRCHMMLFQTHRESNMTRTAKSLGLMVTAALFTAAPLSLHFSPTNAPTVSLERAQARVGRPLTPMSVAGVHRRVHRRAYYGAAAAGAVAAGAAAYGVHHHHSRACGYSPHPPCY